LPKIKNLKQANFEANRVETENRSLLKRILDIHGSIDIKEMRDSYKKVVLFKRRKLKSSENNASLIHSVLKNRQ